MLNYYCDLWDYIFEPLNDTRKFKFMEVISKISWNKVCDLWCGYSWLYWALWYFERVEEIHFYEFYDTYIDKLNFFIDNISPEYLEENFWEVILFLQNNNLISKDKSFEQIAFELLEKITCVEKIDFLKNIPWDNFDTIFANESIECVTWNCDFSKLSNNIFDSLSHNWKLIFIMLWYEDKNIITQELINLKLEWTLDVNCNNINNILWDSWFKKILFHNKIFPELNNRWKYTYWIYLKS